MYAPTHSRSARFASLTGGSLAASRLDSGERGPAAKTPQGSSRDPLAPSPHVRETIPYPRMMGTLRP